MSTAYDYYCNAFSRHIEPQEDISVSEWAALYRVLPKVGSPEPGLWLNERTPYLVAIMDALSPSSPIKRVILMKGTQIGGTEVGINWLLYIMDICPDTVMIVQPTIELARKWSKQRLASTVTESPKLRGKLKDNTGKESGNNILTKEFPGGMFIIIGSNSPANLGSSPLKHLFCDEVDRYPASAKGEGDPIDLARKRSSNFTGSKEFIPSTPVDKGDSKIESEFLRTDQNYYYVPCPHCDELQKITWTQIQWNKDSEGNELAETAYMECDFCHVEIYEHHKTKMLAGGKWIPDHPERSGNVIGFHISALYSPLGWKSWADCVEEYLDAKNDTIKYKTFVNTVLGESYEEKGASLAWEDIGKRREEYSHPVPMGVCVITAAVDVQGDRLELDVVGWGVGEESWRLGFHIIIGDPIARDVWNELDELLKKEYTHESGIKLKIQCCCIDSGSATKQVYEFTKPREHRRVYAIKGSSEPARPIVSRPGTSNKGKCKLFMIGTDTAKETMMSRLKNHNVGPGYCHFSFGYDDEYFKQLCAETMMIRKKDGYALRKWVKKRPRNEATDLFVYNLAAFTILSPKIERISASINEKYDADQEEKENPTPEKQENYFQQIKKRRVKAKKRGGFATNY